MDLIGTKLSNELGPYTKCGINGSHDERVYTWVYDNRYITVRVKKNGSCWFYTEEVESTEMDLTDFIALMKDGDIIQTSKGQAVGIVGTKAFVLRKR